MHAGLDGERVEVGEVREAREAHDHDVEPISACRRSGDGARPGERQRVLGVEGDVVHERQHAEHGHARARFELAEAVAEQRRITPQLVDDEGAYEPPVPVGEQRHGPVQRGEDAAAVDVADHDGGYTELVCDTEVHDVVVEQVDLGRAAGAFEDHDVEAPAEVVARGEHGAQQFRLLGVVVGGVEVADRLAHDDDLARPLAGGLEQDRVHRHLGRRAGGERLHTLGAPDLVT